MNVNLYAVKDVMTGNYIGLAPIRTEREAIRNFKSQLNHIDIWKDNPQDFDLWLLGRYNDETGELTPDLQLVAHGRSVLDE